MEMMTVMKCGIAKAYRTWNEIKLDLKKSRRAVVTVEEFAKYKGYKVEYVLEILMRVKHNISNVDKFPGSTVISPLKNIL